MQPASERCSRCGTVAADSPQPVNYVTAGNVYPESKLARRIPVLTTLWIIYGVLEGAKAAALQFFTHVSSFWWTGSEWSGWAGPWALRWIVLWAFVSAALALVAAWGLYERQSWGRTVAIVAAIFALPHPILGTIFGVYTLVVLLSGDAASQYERIASLTSQR